MFVVFILSNCSQKDPLYSHTNDMINAGNDISDNKEGNFNNEIADSIPNLDGFIDGFSWSYQFEMLLLGIQDESGNDLIKGIKYDWWRMDEIPEQDSYGGVVIRELYSLDFEYTDPLMSPYETHKLAAKSPNVILNEYLPELEMGKMDDRCYFRFNSFHSNRHHFYTKETLPPADKIVIKLTCPYVFGDDKEHEIVTYWKPYERDYSHISYCYRIEFESEVLTPIALCQDNISHDEICPNNHLMRVATLTLKK